MITKNMDSQKLLDNRHEVIINTYDQKKVFDQIVLWGEASWWPKRCMMRFIRIGTAPIQKGTMYHQIVTLPFGPRWLSLVSEVVDNISISRRYFESFISGDEIVRIVPLERTIKVEYLLVYTIKDRSHNVLWKIILKRLHDYNIKLVLNNLKQYIEQ